MPGQLEQLNEHRVVAPAPLRGAALRWQMNEDTMATDTLADGLRQCHVDHLKLQALLAERLQSLG